MAMKRPSLLRALLRDIFSAKTNPLKKLLLLLRFCRLALSRNETVGAALGVPVEVRKALKEVESKWFGGINVDFDAQWDAATDALKKPVLNPVFAFHEALFADGDGKKCTEGNPWAGKKVEVEDAHIFEAHFDEDGRMLRDPKILHEVNHGWPLPHLVRRARGTDEYKNAMERGKKVHDAQPVRARLSREARRRRLEAARRLSREGFGNDFLTDFQFTSQTLDPNQYTEFAPIYGGPFFKQLYLYDYLKQHAYSFEAWNHNPLAKRIIHLMTQYSLGRRFALRIKDSRKKKAWEAADAKFNIEKKIAEFWGNEANIYGEIFVDTDLWQSVDPSTIWDIITDPDNIDDAYYAYQSYPTAFQQFTGYTVPGEPGAAKQQAQKYIIRQIPMSKLLHMKLNCVSNEKRGRATMFPVLGWLKRIKDLYNSQVIRQWLMASFIWDVTIDGNQGDVDAYSAAYSQIPMPGSIHVHNKTVERKPMAALEGANSAAGADIVSENILSFVATATGIPKEYFNVNTRGGGSRAQALTTAEPFTKVIEDLQARWEGFIKEMFKRVMEQAGLDYKPGDVEITFPSVTKDTTTETVKNIQAGEAQGYISKRTAAGLYAQEMNITEYDFEAEQKQIKNDDSKGFNLVGAVPMPPGGRFGGSAPGGDGEDGGSEIHGQGKQDLVDSLKNL